LSRRRFEKGSIPGREREGKKAYVKHSVKRALTFTGAGDLLLEGEEITFLGRFANPSIFGRFGVSTTLED